METRNLETAYPEIAKEWDYAKNGDLLPSQVSKSSAVRVWWKCENGHEWMTSVNNRTSTHQSSMCLIILLFIECPICSGHQISYERSLAFLYPVVAYQWHATKNLPLTPEMVFPFSDRVVWWTCNGVPKSLSGVDLLGHGLKTMEGCGNEWQESVVSRVNKWKCSGTIGMSGFG